MHALSFCGTSGVCSVANVNPILVLLICNVTVMSCCLRFSPAHYAHTRHFWHNSTRKYVDFGCKIIATREQDIRDHKIWRSTSSCGSRQMFCVWMCWTAGQFRCTLIVGTTIDVITTDHRAGLKSVISCNKRTHIKIQWRGNSGMLLKLEQEWYHPYPF